MAIGLRLSAHEYAPGCHQPVHDHDEIHISIVLRGSVSERVGGTTEQAGALSVVVKDRGVRHANGFGPRGATLAQLSIRGAGVSDLLDDPGRLVWWKWCHSLSAVAPFLTLVEQHVPRGDEIAADDADFLDLLSALSARHEEPRRDSPPKWLSDTLTWLRSEWQPRTRVADVAAHAGVHPVYLARCVRRWYGHGVSDELRRLRLRSAAQSVAFRAGDLSQAALDNGYADQAHLCRDFRRATGRTPGDYRATIRRLSVPSGLD